MCGIAGLIAGTAMSAPSVGVVQGMIDVLTHRGPDDGRVWRSGSCPVALGHRRLSILDLSETGAQPMVFAEANLAIAYNGEIYNAPELRDQLVAKGMTFRGTSDTEVLLRAYQLWGSDVFPKLNGMFAVAILDEGRNRLVLARDRSGQKPLYYSQHQDGFAFASEVKALRVWRPNLGQIDSQGLQDYLAYGYGLGDRCLTAGVKKLGAATTLTIDLETMAIREECYWTLPEPHDVLTNEADLLELFEETLAAAVDRHFSSDVPVGVLLSGGIDSSLITAMAAKTRGKVKTFSVAFPDNAARDETVYARQISEAFDTDHYELRMSAVEGDELERLAWQFDDPIADHAMVPMYLLSHTIRQHVTVALGGDGGDELFGGYPHYGLIEQQACLRAIPAPLRNIGRLARHLRPGVRGRNHIIGLAGDLGEAIGQVNLYFDAGWRQRLTGETAPIAPENTRAGLSVLNVGATPLRRAMAADFRTTMAEGYMAKVDRAAMMASLEIRAPFLDNEMIRFAWSRVPDILKFHNKQDKILPRKLACKLLPSDVSKKRKQGLTMPLDQWMRRPQGNFVTEVLSDPSQDIFDRKAVQKLLGYQAAGLNNSSRLFALAMIVLWARAHKMTRA